MTVTNSEKVTDPICGMSIDPATAAATVEHDGKTDYFCSQGCADTFVANGYTGDHHSS
ncbi:YHS domain-containing protein [Demequina lutea]|uniref:Cu+-exporting ATPase n=1 Tax=Demequina lutea TaxID=431489 RepID=A0A7Y9Z9K0_9MICO|nr:YHS domain-containing protein [Demequina lutea]NYI41317.1 Cu+-exporting ATPase [Demequina lutea]